MADGTDFERFMVFAFLRAGPAGGANDFVVTANLPQGPGLLDALAVLLEREGVDRASADTIHLVEASAVLALSPIVCLEVSVEGSGGPGGRIEARDMRLSEEP